MERIDTKEMTLIVKSLKDNNLEMFDRFYDLTKKQVYFAIMSILKNRESTEDIMQDTYMRFLNNIDKYKEGTNVIAFLVTIARNLAINLYNRNKKEIKYDFTRYEATYTNDPKDNSLMEIVYETLEEDELEVFILHVIDDLKHKEIAKIMKKPLGTITWIYNKAVKKLKKKVGEQDE